jgi:DNA-binding transcriptional ArsR family regulator
VLKDAGLVVDTRAGKQRIYRLDPDGLRALRADLERFWRVTREAQNRPHPSLALAASAR